MDAAKIKTAKISWRSLYKVAGMAASMEGILLLIAMISLIASVLLPGATTDWVSLFQNNWLIIIFKLHAGFGGIQIDRLHILNYPDIVILALMGTTLLGLYAALRKTGRAWSMIAVAQPFLGIVLFIVTRSAGRSSVMGAGLVISIVMLWNKNFSRVIACMGILASAILLVGDLTAGVLHSRLITVLCGMGYVLLTTWLFLIARRLFQSGQTMKG